MSVGVTVALSLFGGTCNIIAVSLLKHIWNQKARMSPEDQARFVIWQEFLFWVAASVFTVGEVLVALPTEEEPNSEAVAEAWVLIIGFCVAKYYGEKCTTKEAVVYWMIVLGAAFSFFQVETTEVSITVFIIYVFLVVFAVLGLSGAAYMVHNEAMRYTHGLADANAVRARKLTPVVYSALMAFMQSLVSVPVVLFIYSSTSFGVILIVFFLGFLLTAGVEVFFLTITLEKYDMIYVLAMFHVCLRSIEFMVTWIFGGFKEENPILYIVLPAIGLMLMYVGAYFLSQRENFSLYHTLDSAPEVAGGRAGEISSDSASVEEGRGRRSRSRSLSDTETTSDMASSDDADRRDVVKAAKRTSAGRESSTAKPTSGAPKTAPTEDKPTSGAPKKTDSPAAIAAPVATVAVTTATPGDGDEKKESTQL